MSDEKDQEVVEEAVEETPEEEVVEETPEVEEVPEPEPEIRGGLG